MSNLINAELQLVQKLSITDADYCRSFPFLKTLCLAGLTPFMDTACMFEQGATVFQASLAPAVLRSPLFSAAQW